MTIDLEGIQKKASPICDCVRCCGGEHPGECEACAGWGDRSTEEITGICESCDGTGVCPKCGGGKR